MKSIKFSCLIITTVILVTLTACGIGHIRQSVDYTKIAETLNEKYNENFKFINCYPANGGTYEVVGYSEKHPKSLFETKIASNGTYISDDYVSSRICSKIEEIIAYNINGLDYNYIVKVGSVANNVKYLDANMSIEEFQKLIPANRYAVYLIIDSSEKTIDNAEIIEKAFTGLVGISGNLNIYETNNDKMYEIDDWMENNAEVEHSFDKILNDSVQSTYSFENGVVNKLT